jgi:hypothetical protein
VSGVKFYKYKLLFLLWFRKKQNVSEFSVQLSRSFSVSTETRYTLHDRSSVPVQAVISVLSIAVPRLATPPLVQWAKGTLCLVVKQLEYEVDRSRPSGAEVKNARSYTFTSPHRYSETTNISTQDQSLHLIAWKGNKCSKGVGAKRI